MEKNERIAWYRSLGLGMFVHYGLYSVLGKGEWALYYGKPDNYSSICLNPKKDWATELMRQAKILGCKYVTLTTRHHDGFSLYDTKGLSDFDAPHSACKRDLVLEFVEAANKEGIVPFFYHTLIDWRHEAMYSSFDDYLRFLRLSIELLCTNYGKIGGFWFDGMWQYPNADWHENELYSIIRKYQPSAVIINNTGLNEQGKLGHPELDGVTFERGLPAPSDVAGEVCESLNDTWGFSQEDIMFKPPLDHLIGIALCRSMDCNYLLNVGPLKDGTFGQIEKGIIEKVGLWVHKHSEAIFNVHSSCVKTERKNAVITENDECYYVFCFNVPMGANSHVFKAKPCSYIPLELDCKKAIWLDDGSDITLINKNNEVILPVVPFAYGTSLGIRVAKIFKR